jgi:hypothetical protein
MTITKIFQVQGNGNAHYVATTSKTRAIKIAKEIYPTEKINFACDKTKAFTEEELNNLPEYVIVD